MTNKINSLVYEEASTEIENNIKYLPWPVLSQLRDMVSWSSSAELGLKTETTTYLLVEKSLNECTLLSVLFVWVTDVIKDIN